MNSRQKSINANVFIDYKVDVEHICHELESQGLEVLDFELDENHNLGTGHAYEKENSSFINKTSYIENCETSAVGRALSFIGIGSETTIASYEEVANAIQQQEGSKKISKKEVDLLLKLWTDAGGTEAQLKDHCKVKALTDITSDQFGKVMQQLQEKEDGK